MKILETCWGGHGEHGVLEVYMELDENQMILSLCDRSYSDWGSGSQLTREKKKSKSYDINSKSITKTYLYDCVIDFVENESNIKDYKIKEEDIIYER